MTRIEQLHATAQAQGDVILSRQSRAILGRSGHRTAIRRGIIEPLWAGAYRFGPLDLAQALRAADLTFGAPMVPLLQTAAALYGFDLSEDNRLHLLAPGDFNSRRAQIELHRLHPLAPLQMVAGRPTMHPVETAIRLAAGETASSRRSSNGPPRALSILDAAIRSGAVSGAAELGEFAATVSIRGIRAIRSLAPWADGRAESPRESWLRWVFLSAGLPAPDLQYWVETSAGRSYRLDLAWPAYKVGCEYDGVAFHTGEALWRDRRRLNDLTADSWLMTSATDVMVRAGRLQLVAHVAGALRRRGAIW